MVAAFLLVPIVCVLNTEKRFISASVITARQDRLTAEIARNVKTDG